MSDKNENVDALPVAGERRAQEEGLRRRDTDEQRAFWDFVEQCSRDWDLLKPNWQREIDEKRRGADL